MNRHLTASIAWLIAVTAAVSAEPRLAIIPAEARCITAVDLLTAGFSQHDIALLERAEVDRIQREQNLTARSSADFARLGRTLGADGVLVLEISEQKNSTNMTAKLIAVKPGVALGFSAHPWPLENPMDWARLVPGQFASALPKLDVLARDAVPVSVLNLRAPLKTAEDERLEKDATLLLVNRLIAVPELFVLERQRLALLGAEKELQEVDETPFWNGSYLIEGVIEHGGASPEEMTVTARLVSPDRTSITLRATTRDGELNNLIEELARTLVQHLKPATTLPVWNRAAEAARYFEEARWAMRWKAYPQAQWAADSAWALGKTDLETARLRVTSYSRPAVLLNTRMFVSAGRVTPNDGVFPQALDPIATALENFIQLTPRLATNAPPELWRQTGAEALGIAGAHLWRFWHTKAEAALVMDKLSRLRSLARDTERLLLDGIESPSAPTYQTGFGSNLWQMRLSVGWVWSESVQHTIGEFRRLFASGLSETQQREFVSLQTAWLMPWNAEEERMAPMLWNDFVRELASSTNSLNALTASMLAIRNTPGSDLTRTPAVPTRQEQAASDFLLRHRDDLLCAHPAAVKDALDLIEGRVWHFLPRVRSPAADAVRTNYLPALVQDSACFDEELAARLFQIHAFATNHLEHFLRTASSAAARSSAQQSEWRRRLFTAYLAAGSRRDGYVISEIGVPYHAGVMQYLFRPEDFNAEQAQAVLPAFKKLQSQAPGKVDKEVALLESIASPSQVKNTPPPQKPRAPAPLPAAVAAQPDASNALAVTHWWQPAFSQSVTPNVLKHSILQTISRAGSIWAHVRFVQRVQVPGYEPGTFEQREQAMERFERIDPVTLSATVSPAIVRDGHTAIPQPFFAPLPPYEVINGVLYVHEGEKLLAWKPGDTEWHSIKVALPAQMTMRAIGSRLYFASEDTLLEADPESLAVRAMASLRRSPPLVLEDRLPEYRSPQFIEGPTGTVLVIMNQTIRPWNVLTGKWGDAVAGGPGLGVGRLSIAPDHFLFREESPRTRDVEYRRINTSGTEELLFRIENASFGPFRRRSSTERRATWNVPAEIGLGQLASAADGTNLWCLDWGQRALGFFEPSWNEPLVLPLKFVPAELPSAAPAGTPPHFYLSLQAAPEGLLLSAKFALGFWVIPQSDLAGAIARAAVGRARTLNTNVATLARIASVRSAAGTNSAWADEAAVDPARILRTYDRSGDARLDMGELVQAIAAEKALAPYGSLTAKFQTTLLLIAPYDTNGNGHIDVGELEAMTKASKPRVTFEEFMEKHDTNRNGQLDAEEVRAAVLARSPSRGVPRSTGESRTNSPARSTE